MRSSYDIVSDAVRKFWKKTYPQPVIAFFYQKYEFEADEKYEYCQELVSPEASDDYETVTFETDFCEGQTCVKHIQIIPLDEIIDYYIEQTF